MSKELKQSTAAILMVFLVAFAGLILHLNKKFDILETDISNLQKNRSYELDVVDHSFILYNGNVPVVVLDSTEIGKLSKVIWDDNE